MSMFALRHVEHVYVSIMDVSYTGKRKYVLRVSSSPKHALSEMPQNWVQEAAKHAISLINAASLKHKHAENFAISSCKWSSESFMTR